MGDISEERPQKLPPFTYCGLDMLCPFTLKCRRTEFNTTFTCLAGGAVYLEVANTMDTDSFIQGIRRFIGKRGNVRMLRSDNGSNFMWDKLNYQKSFKK